MFTTLAVAGTFILTNLCKKWIQPKFGDTGVHIAAFVIAFFIVSVRGLMTYYPPLQLMLLSAGKYLVASLALYELIVKQLKDRINLPTFLG